LPYKHGGDLNGDLAFETDQKLAVIRLIDYIDNFGFFKLDNYINFTQNILKIAGSDLSVIAMLKLTLFAGI
jgi:hypothetical protein